MRNLLLWNLPLAIAAILLLSTGEAEARGWANGYGMGGVYQSLDYPTERRVPYFAAHPPVYYSYPVPRTYGHSPFAYPPSHKTPELMSCEKPVVIQNPHVSSSASQSKPVKQKVQKDRSVSHQEEAAAGPLMVENPFFSADFH